MKILLISVMVFILSSCCTESNYQKLINSRIGLKESELVELIGNPTSVYNTNESKSLEYTISDTTCNEFGCYTNWCTTQYILKDNIVKKSLYRGNDCYSCKFTWK